MVRWICPECGREWEADKQECRVCAPQGPLPPVIPAPPAVEESESAGETPPEAVLCPVRYSMGTTWDLDLIADWSVAPLKVRWRPPVLGNHLVDIPRDDWDALHQLARAVQAACPAPAGLLPIPCPAPVQLAEPESDPPAAEIAPTIVLPRGHDGRPVAEPAPEYDHVPVLIPEVVGPEPIMDIAIPPPALLMAPDDEASTLLAPPGTRLAPSWLVSLVLTLALIASLTLLAYLVAHARTRHQSRNASPPVVLVPGARCWPPSRHGVALRMLPSQSCSKGNA